MENESILKFAKVISGIYSNKSQALANPKKFAHIKIHIRPLFLKTFNCYAFYSEQSYEYDQWNPYRQSINKLSAEKDIFIMSNYKIENQERFAGGGSNIYIFEEISKFKLYKKIGCSMHFKEFVNGNYLGNIEPGEGCLIRKSEKLTYVKSEVKINKKRFISEDSGYEKDTKKKAWGSKFGPLVFEKLKSFDEFIENNWK
tara:strand:+ start:453 stop:1052 length:600 start_codon:yes stop_codon:yes gene_type:complete